MALQYDQEVKFVPSDDYADNPIIAYVDKILGDDRIDLSYPCLETKTWKSFSNVPIFEKSNGDTNEPYYIP